jgi:hypothetical protein
MQILKHIFVIALFCAAVAHQVFASPEAERLEFDGKGAGPVVLAGKIPADKGKITNNDLDPASRDSAFTCRDIEDLVRNLGNELTLSSIRGGNIDCNCVGEGFFTKLRTQGANDEVVSALNEICFGKPPAPATASPDAATVPVADDKNKTKEQALPEKSDLNTGSAEPRKIMALVTAQTPSYADNGDGTITDNNTGLVWQKCSAGQDDLDCGGEARGYGWNEANTYCSSNSAGLPGSNWRLPSRTELETIVDKKNVKPAINTTYFPGTIASHYWSSTIHAYNRFAWFVYFNYGFTNFVSKANSYYVRCVR